MKSIGLVVSTALLLAGATFGMRPVFVIAIAHSSGTGHANTVNQHTASGSAYKSGLRHGVLGVSTVPNKVLYMASGNRILALTPSNGKKIWIYTDAGGHEFASSPTVVNGVAYVGSYNAVYALNASTGSKIWTYKTRDIVESPTAVVDGVVYVSSDGAYLYALDASTGAALWISPHGGTRPVVVNGVVYEGSGSCYALKASTGIAIWSRHAKGCHSSAVANGLVYFGADDGLYALKTSTGAIVWKHPISGTATPIVANGRCMWARATAICTP